MSTKNLHRNENSGTDLRSVGDYEYEFTAHGTHAWEHEETGLSVELRKRAGLTDGYGNVEHGYTAIARDADGKAVDEICGSAEAAYLPTKAEAWNRVREWMEARSDGELRGDEEVEL